MSCSIYHQSRIVAMESQPSVLLIMGIYTSEHSVVKPRPYIKYFDPWPKGMWLRMPERHTLLIYMYLFASYFLVNHVNGVVTVLHLVCIGLKLFNIVGPVIVSDPSVQVIQPLLILRLFILIINLFLVLLRVWFVRMFVVFDMCLLFVGFGLIILRFIIFLARLFFFLFNFLLLLCQWFLLLNIFLG